MSRNEIRIAVLIAVTSLLVGMLFASLAKAETVKKFEISSVIRGTDQQPGDKFKAYLFGPHQQFVIGSDDSGVKKEMDKLVGLKVRVLVFEEVK